MAEALPSMEEPLTELLKLWIAETPGLSEGLRPFQEILLPPQIAPPPADEAIWGAALPADIRTGVSAEELAAACRAAGYFVGGLPTDPGPAAEQLRGARTVLVGHSAAVSSGMATAVGHFVRNGGGLVVFGYGSALGPNGSMPCYALHGPMGGHWRAPVAFDTASTRVSFGCDSVWGGLYPPENVIDGRTDTFWASEEGEPMPHWLELRLGAPSKIGGAVVRCRPGFLLRDVELQAEVGGAWKTLASVKSNEAWEIDLSFDKPVETQALRVLVTAATMGGEERVIADIGELAPYDSDGRPIIAPPYRIDATISDPVWATQNRVASLGLRSPAVGIEPGSREVLGSFRAPMADGELPLCVRQPWRKGAAYHFAVPEGALISEPGVFEGILRTVVGEPAIRHSGDGHVRAAMLQHDRYYLLLLADLAPDASPERSKEIMVRVNTRKLGKLPNIEMADGIDLTWRESGDFVQFMAPLDPSSAIVLVRDI